MLSERDNRYYFFRANQQKSDTKIYSLTQCSITVNKCDWHILKDNEERIKSHCLTHGEKTTLVKNKFDNFKKNASLTIQDYIENCNLTTIAS